MKGVGVAPFLVDCLGLCQDRIVGRISFVFLSYRSFQRLDASNCFCFVLRTQIRYVMRWSRLTICKLQSSAEHDTQELSYRETEAMSVKIGVRMKFPLEVHIFACIRSHCLDEKAGGRRSGMITDLTKNMFCPSPQNQRIQDFHNIFQY